MDLQSKFGYCITTQTLNIALCLKWDGITDRQTDGRTDRQTRRTDDPITRCPRRTFQAGGIKMDSTHHIMHTAHDVICIIHFFHPPKNCYSCYLSLI